MARSKNKRGSLNYASLESRRLLAGDTSFFLDASSGTLFVTAAQTNIAGANFANEMTFSLDSTTNELVVDEANCDLQRFSAAAVNQISYRGTFENDLVLNNTDIDMRVVGFAGDDNITTGGGNDRVIGGNGDDIIRTGDGDDFATGNRGDDQILEDENDTGKDRFFGGDGADIIQSGADDDFVIGHEGDDIITLGTGNDIALGIEGNNQIDGGDGRDLIFGGLGNDILNGDAGNDRILGREGDDVISGGDANDTLIGNDGGDTLNGEAGDDTIIGGEGDDDLNGGLGRDRIISAVANDSNLSSGRDTIITGDDTEADIVTGHPADTLFGESNDVIIDVNQVRLIRQSRFLTSNANQPGWNVTDSGLQYRIVAPGNAIQPSSTDRVRVNYAGTFIDGVQFDANDDISFGLNQVIAGWTEGLQLIGEGGTIDLAIPANLAYGESGRPTIPGGATLLFTVDLLEVV
jgi:hypothetical protein